MQRFSQSCFLALSLSILFTSILFAQSRQTPAQRWEYFTVQLCNHNREELNKYGDDGWELVTVFGDQSNRCGNYTFKRLKAANAPKYVDPNERPKPPANAPTCNLTLAQAPTLRGLRLGMTLEELSELFPGVSLNELKLHVEKAAGYLSFGQTGYGFRGEQHKERPENLGFFVTLFDGRVRGYKVEYRFNNQTSYGSVFSNEQMIDKLIDELKLPPKENWRSDYQGKVSLYCQGFKLEFYAQAGTYISVEDTSPSYAEKVKQRQIEDAAKKQSAFKP